MKPNDVKKLLPEKKYGWYGKGRSRGDGDERGDDHTTRGLSSEPTEGEPTEWKSL